MNRDHFEENLSLPYVSVPDWALAARLEDLLTPAALSSAPLRVEAKDARGSYERETIAAVRAEAERRGDTPHTLRIYISGVEADGFTGRFLNVYASTKVGAGARLISGDEALVHHLRLRIEELFAAAAPPPGVAPPVSAVPEPPERAAVIRAALHHPVISTVVGGLILALLLGGIGWVVGSSGEGASTSPDSTPGLTAAETGEPTTTAVADEPTVQHAWNRKGVPTFSNYRDASGPGPRLRFQQAVKVSCKVLDTSVASANPGGYWYRIQSPPWNDRFYAVANTFLNGDPPNGPYERNVDPRVPDC